MLNSYVRYESGKTKNDYHHPYQLNIPIPMWKELERISKDKHCPISVLIRTYIEDGLARENYYCN